MRPIVILGHSTIYAERDVYAGWPANHGAWQWGDEFLVGFMTGPHNIGRGTHNIWQPYTKRLARSLDGGRTWRTEVPDCDFSASQLLREPVPPFDLTTSIIRVCGRYDTGGMDCVQEGGFYLSRDRGKTWSGAYSFDMPKVFAGEMHNTSRTSTLDDMVFLTAAKKHYWGTDMAFMCRVENGKFVDHSLISTAEEGRFVMPRAARNGGRLVVVARRLGRQRAGGWIDAVTSDDGGKTWGSKIYVGSTGSDNGNPPALAEHDGVLYCAYANRSNGQLLLSRSADGGESWSWSVVLRDKGDSDIGYPQLFKRSDGTLVCVYYWADFFEDEQRIEATRFAT